MTEFSASFETNIVEQTVQVELEDSSSVLWRAGQVNTLRDENGNVILYEDQNDPSANLKRHDQYIGFNFQERIFDTGEIDKVIDTKISELYSDTSIQSKIERFFNLFENLVLQIPVGGNINSLTYLLQKISEITGNAIVDPNLFSQISGSYSDLQGRFSALNDLLNAISADSASLKFENENLQQQIEILAEVIINNLTGEKITIEQLIALLNQGVGKIVSTPEVYAEVNSEYHYDVIANVEISEWQLSSAPNWLVIQALLPRQARIIGTPPEGSEGEQIISIRAVGPRGTIYQTYNLIIEIEGTNRGGGTPSGYRVLLDAALLAGTVNTPQIGVSIAIPPVINYKIFDADGILINEVNGMNPELNIAGLPFGSSIEFNAEEVSVTTLGPRDPETGIRSEITTVYSPAVWVRQSNSGVITKLSSSNFGAPTYTFENIDNDYHLYVLYSEIT